jgi:hypothetical protein
MAAKRGKATRAVGATRRGRLLRGARAKARGAGPRAARAEELAAEPRALLGRDEEARAVRPRKEDASVEDPLGDWPEDQSNGESR